MTSISAVELGSISARSITVPGNISNSIRIEY